jgi:hypothetical protein
MQESTISTSESDIKLNMLVKLDKLDILKPLKIMSFVKLMYSCQPGEASLISTAFRVMLIKPWIRLPPRTISRLNVPSNSLEFEPFIYYT